MRKRILSVALVGLMVMFCYINANAKGIIPDQDNGLQQIKTTAYMLDGTTASGRHTRRGICAGQEWMVEQAIESGTGSWVAMIWTADGTEFLGYYEVLDTGGTEAIKNGYVVDVWFSTYEECVEWMEITEGKCLIKYVWAEG